MPDLAALDWANDALFDSAIVRHGFTPYMRDYDLIVEVPAAKPDRSGSYIESQYRYRFTHCVEAHVEKTLRPHVWSYSWTDDFTTYTGWEAAGSPNGFVWGVEFSDAYPGASRVAESPRAEAWGTKVGRDMHEVRIETNAFLISLICHDLQVTRLASGDPDTGELSPLDP